MIVTDINELRNPITEATKDEGLDIISKLEQVLLETKPTGIGLAAPQIGIKKKVAIIRFEKYSINLINPIIVKREQLAISYNEGCLSLPNTKIDAQRYKEIFIKDLLHPEGLVGLDEIAIILQHEIDHLEGILIIDRATGKNKIKRNDLCPCNSKKKWKKCHGRNL